MIEFFQRPRRDGDYPNPAELAHQAIPEDLDPSRPADRDELAHLWRHYVGPRGSFAEYAGTPPERHRDPRLGTAMDAVEQPTPRVRTD